MATDLIRYDLLVQDAIRGVVRKVLTDASRDGLPGDHYFYITFRTKAAGVRLSTRMRERYPIEMTIVLQYEFWELSVTEHAFEVGLSFNKVPERLLIPFEALTGFSDPSVPFSFKFEYEEETASEKPPSMEAQSAEPVRLGPTVVPKSGEPVTQKPTAKLPAPKGPARAEAAKPEAVKVESAAKAPPAESETAPKVVSIDAFRKKP